MAKKSGPDLGLLVLGASALFLFLRLSKETEKGKQNRAIREELRAGITPPSLGGANAAHYMAQGARAWKNIGLYAQSPHKPGSWQYKAWWRGYFAAKAAHQRKAGVNFGAATLRSQGWSKRGKNYAKSSGALRAYLAPRDGGYGWSVEGPQDRIQQGHSAVPSYRFIPNVLKTGWARNATEAAEASEYAMAHFNLSYPWRDYFGYDDARGGDY